MVLSAHLSRLDVELFQSQSPLCLAGGFVLLGLGYNRHESRLKGLCGFGISAHCDFPKKKVAESSATQII
jgi:hypothetical protein